MHKSQLLTTLTACLDDEAQWAGAFLEGQKQPPQGHEEGSSYFSSEMTDESHKRQLPL